MIFFTSITYNYLAKASVLASSVKKYNPSAKFVLVLCEPKAPNVPLSEELFDSVFFIDTLNLPVQNLQSWIFKHSVVELCTAVKGHALDRLLREFNSPVVYLDPDIVVTHSLDQLSELLKTNSILLTPHLTDQENSRAGILDNEISTLKHGIYNLGFVGVKPDENGLAFSRWWRDRLLEFCYNEIPDGLFTDQKWADLVPAIFGGVHIIREKTMNVATWNLPNRKVTKDSTGSFTIDGKPMLFYHFSGFDSGSHLAMYDRYGTESPALPEFRDWYIREQEKYGQSTVKAIPFAFKNYSNGTPITDLQRKVYRNFEYLQKDFPNPFDASSSSSYLKWYHNHGKSKLIERFPDRHFGQFPTVKQIIQHRSPALFAFLKRLKKKYT